jgi:hypothetical protein
MAADEICLRVLAFHLATAHRLTVPPDGERTIIVIAVASFHLSSEWLQRLKLERPLVKRKPGAKLVPAVTFLPTSE